MLWLRILIALTLLLGALYPTWARKLSLWDRLEDPRKVFPMTFHHPHHAGLFYSVPLRLRERRPETFNVHVDTGSAKLWLYSAHCASAACAAGAHRYIPGGPAFAWGKEHSTHFADGTSIDGKWAEDWVAPIGKPMEFLLADRGTATLPPGVVGGLGLGLPKKGKGHRVLWAHGPRRVFSLCFGTPGMGAMLALPPVAHDGSRLTIGGATDCSGASAPVWIPVASEYRWELPLSAVEHAGRTLMLGRRVLLDSGSVTSAAPAADVKAFWDFFYAHPQSAAEAETDWTLVFAGGTRVPVKELFSYRRHGRHEMSLHPSPSHLNGTWILGLDVLTRLHSVFDADRRLVGLAPML